MTGNSCIPDTQRTGKGGREPKFKQAGMAGIKTEMRAMVLLSRGSTVRDCRQMDFQAQAVSVRINGV